jgi:Ni,Fe-hydrogenase III component G
MTNSISALKEKFAGKILKIDEKSPRRIYLDINPDSVTKFAEFMSKDMGCRFVTASGIHTPEGFEILYHFSDDPAGVVVSLRAAITDKHLPQIESITPVIRGAEWIEREMRELLGINFKNHPNPKRLLLADEWPEGKYPLRHEHKHERDHES